MRLIRVFAVYLFFCSQLSSSQPERATLSNYTLDMLVDRALKESDQIRSQKARILEKQEAQAQAGFWANPNLNLNVGTKYLESEFSPSFDISLAQDFDISGKRRARGELAGIEKKLKEIDLLESELSIATEVIRLSYGYAINERKIRYAENRQSRFRLLQSYLAGHTFASPTQQTTSMIVKGRLQDVEADSVRLRGEQKSNLAELGFYVRLDPESSPTISVPWLRGERQLVEDEWVKKTLEQNLSIAKQRIEQEKAKHEETLFRREIWPDFSLSATYGQEFARDPERTFSVGIGIPLPLWNRNQASLRSSTHKIQAEGYLASLKENQSRTIVQKLLAAYEIARSVAGKYPENTIAKLEANLQKMEREFRKNRIDFLLFLELDMQASETIAHVLDAQQALIEAIISLFAVSRDASILAELKNF